MTLVDFEPDQFELGLCQWTTEQGLDCSRNDGLDCRRKLRSSAPVFPATTVLRSSLGPFPRLCRYPSRRAVYSAGVRAIGPKSRPRFLTVRRISSLKNATRDFPGTFRERFMAFLGPGSGVGHHQGRAESSDSSRKRNPV